MSELDEILDRLSVSSDSKYIYFEISPGYSRILREYLRGMRDAIREAHKQKIGRDCICIYCQQGSGFESRSCQSLHEEPVVAGSTGPDPVMGQPPSANEG